MSSFNPFANSHNAVIVAPDGLRGSFNGLDCCGYARDSKIDDIKFFSQIQHTLEGEFPLFVNSSYSYGVGWSNGGFMIMYASRLFKAISPISGYIIDTTNIMEGTGIFFHHGLQDQVVRPTGCCANPNTNSSSCCCGIKLSKCVSVQAVMKDIAQKQNSCISGEDGTFQFEQSFEDVHRGISCMTATGKSCIANSTICLYNHSRHFGSFATEFPMKEQVMDFFATDMCISKNGLWSDRNKTCYCQETKFESTFCFDLTG